LLHVRRVQRAGHEFAPRELPQVRRIADLAAQRHGVHQGNHIAAILEKIGMYRRSVLGPVAGQRDAAAACRTHQTRRQCPCGGWIRGQGVLDARELAAEGTLLEDRL
jgi:hypothetical protein